MFFYKVLKVLKINKRFAYFLLLKSDLSKSLRSLRSLTKNEWTSETLIYFEGIAPSLIFCKKRVIRVENRWSNSQPWSDGMRIQNPSQTCTWPTCSVLVILRHQTLKNISFFMFDFADLYHKSRFHNTYITWTALKFHIFLFELFEFLKSLNNNVTNLVYWLSFYSVISLWSQGTWSVFFIGRIPTGLTCEQQGQ